MIGMKWHYLDSTEPLNDVQVYLINVATAASRFGNALAGGDPAESICARVARASLDGHQGAMVLELLINNVLFREEDHCLKALECPDRCRTVSGRPESASKGVS